MTDEGADYCFECVGLTSLMQDAFASSRQGGCTIILGAQVHGTPIHINAFSLLNERTIAGSLFGGIKAKVDIPKLAQKYMQKTPHHQIFSSHRSTLHDSTPSPRPSACHRYVVYPSGLQQFLGNFFGRVRSEPNPW
nr:alcohol dehydrogenase-like 1 [Ipomoea batatas]